MKAVKFQFERSFDEEARAAERAAEVQRERDLVTAKSRAHAAGYDEGRTTALAEIEARTLTVLEEISASAKDLFAGHAELQQQMEERLVKLSYSIASKFAGQLIKSQPLAEIEALIRDCLDECREEPRIVVRVRDADADAVIDRIDAMKQATGFPGDLVVLGDPDLGDVTCRVEWADGGREIDPRELGNRIEKTIQTFLAAGSQKAEASKTAKPAAQPADKDEVTPKKAAKPAPATKE